MRRGTTPTLKISLNIELKDVKNIYVTLKQGYIILNKEKNDLDIVGKEIFLDLSQEDTLKLKDGNVDIQIRVLFNNGEAFASDIKTLSVLDILKDGEIR